MLKKISAVVLVTVGLVACDASEQKQSNEQKMNER